MYTEGVILKLLGLDAPIDNIELRIGESTEDIKAVCWADRSDVSGVSNWLWSKYPSDYFIDLSVGKIYTLYDNYAYQDRTISVVSATGKTFNGFYSSNKTHTDVIIKLWESRNNVPSTNFMLNDTAVSILNGKLEIDLSETENIISDVTFVNNPNSLNGLFSEGAYDVENNEGVLIIFAKCQMTFNENITANNKQGNIKFIFTHALGRKIESNSYITLEREFYLTYPPVEWNHNIIQTSPDSFITITSYSTTGSSQFWTHTAFGNIYDTEIFEINNITTSSFGENKEIIISFSGNTVTNIAWYDDLTSLSIRTDFIYSIINNGYAVKLKRDSQNLYNTTFKLLFNNNVQIQVKLNLTTITNAPTITTGTSDNFTMTGVDAGVTLYGHANLNDVVQKYGIEYGTTIAYLGGLITSNNINSNSTNQTFSIQLTTLIAGTVYHYRAWGVNAVGEDYGNDGTFLTLPSSYINDVSNIGYTNVRFNATVYGQASSYGFKYQLSSGGTIYNITATNRTENTYYYNLTGLSPDTEYVVWAWATNSTGTVSSDQVKIFLTDTEAAEVSSSSSNVSYTTTTIIGSYTQGSFSIVDGGFEWGLTTELSKDPIEISNVSNPFSYDLTNLTADTTYYYRAFVIDSHNNVYKAATISSFKTSAYVITYDFLIDNQFDTFDYSGDSVIVTVTPEKYINGVLDSNNLAWTTSSIDFDDAIASISPAYGTGITEVTITINPNISSNNTDSTDREAYITFALVASSSTTVSYDLLQYGITVPDVYISDLSVDSPQQITVECTVSLDDFSVGNYGVYKATSSGGTYVFTQASNLSSNVFTVVFTGLTAETPYYFKGYVSNEGGLYKVTSYETITTSGILPEVYTKTVSTTAYTLKLTAEITDRGSSSLTACGFVINNTTYNVTVPTGVDVFSLSLDSSDGITPETTYYYYAFATNNAGTYEETQSSTTTPSAITNPTISITNYTVLSRTEIEIEVTVNDGGADLTTCYVYWKRTIDENYGTPDTVNISAGTTYFTHTIDGLSPDTEYRVFVRGTNASSLSDDSNIINAETDPAVAPTVIVTDSSSTYYSITMYGEVTDDGGSAITACGFRYSRYISEGQLVSPTTVSTTSGYTFSKLINTGLLQSTTYYFQAYATNSIGTSYSSIDNIATTAQPQEINLTLTSSGNGYPVYVVATLTTGTAASNLSINVLEFTSYIDTDGTVLNDVHIFDVTVTIASGQTSGSVSTGKLKTVAFQSAEVSDYTNSSGLTANTILSVF